ncbi:MAG: Holliday junction branch migration protein RuvA [Oscillospiraceae bacterium]|jgi:Holliday junction DNA helicase RuvA|nr:Holliday junction branch migration protein RuvA [Oscillospiraceae bacterium]
MLYSLNGKLTHMQQGLCVIECGGVGFCCQTTLNTQRNVKLGEQTLLYTYMNVREDAIELFGFSSTSELSVFKSLISVNGVGAKVGVAILSVLTPEQVALSISSGDYKTITKANGVGPKLAQRIILELKDKVGISLKNQEVSAAPGSVVPLSQGNIGKAVEALSVLGFAAGDVAPVLARFDPQLPIEQLIAKTLQAFGGKN